MQHEATLANGTIASTRVSRRVMMNASKHPRMELNQVDDFNPPPEDDMSEVTIPASLEDGSCTGDDDGGGGAFDGDDFACPHQDAIVVEDDDGESYMAHMIPPGAPHINGDGDNQGSDGVPPLGTRYSTPLETALSMLPMLLPHESALVELLVVLCKPQNSLQMSDMVVKWLEEHLSKSTFKDTKKLPRQ